MDFMFDFFRRMSANQLSVADLNYSSSSTFRKYVDELCSRENSGWKKVVIPVEVEGFRHLKVRRTCCCWLLPRIASPSRWPVDSDRPPRCLLPCAKIPDVQLVYRDPVQMLTTLITQFAKMEQFCWRWAYTPEAATADGEKVTEHPASAGWWREQAEFASKNLGSLLALQLYSDDTTLNNKRSRSAYPLYCVPVNGSFDLYKLLFPACVVAYMPVLTCPFKGGSWVASER